MATIVAFKVSNAPAQELEEIFKEHHQFVYRTAYGVTGNKEDAEDVLQSIFASLVRRELPPDLIKSPKAYLYRAAFNFSLNTLRYRKRHPSSGDVDRAEAIVPPPRSIENDDLDKRLHAAIAELHPTAAQIVVLRYVHNQSLAQIAKLMGTTLSTVGVSLFRSRARLKKLIREQGKKS
jgi:RNA polymerase sigma-70 factor (ECF subfamily)